MKIKVFCPNTNGKLEFTKEELERMLNEAYEDGYRDGRNHYSPWYCTTSLSGSANAASTNIRGYVDSVKATDATITNATSSTDTITSALEGVRQMNISDLLEG